MAREVGARTAMALVYESVYGTSPVSGYTRMPYAGAGLRLQQPLLASELLGNGRDPIAPVKDAVEVSGAMTVPIDAISLGFWLKGLMGQPTTTGTTTFTHTFQSNGWTLPSMSIEMQYPAIPQFNMFKGVMVNGLSWQMNRSGLLTAEVALVAQDEVPAAATAAGALASVAMTRFGNFNGAIRRDGSALASVVSASINYQNNLDPVGVIRADGLVDGFDPGMTSLSGSVTVRVTDRVLYEQAISGAPSELIFEYAPSANATFRFTAHAVYFPRAGIPVEGPNGLEVTFDWVAAQATSPARMATVVLINNRATY